jgi:hypothetical protein
MQVKGLRGLKGSLSLQRVKLSVTVLPLWVKPPPLTYRNPFRWVSP